MRCHRDRNGGVHAGQLLDGDRVRKRVGAGAAVLLRNRHAHQAELGHAGDELVGKAALAVELLGDGRYAFAREVAHRRANELVLLVEIEVQALRRWASSAISRTP